MPKEKKPSWWPNNPYRKYTIAYSLINPDYRFWQEASNACAKAVNEHQDKMRELLDEIHSAFPRKPCRLERPEFERWQKEVTAILNMEKD